MKKVLVLLVGLALVLVGVFFTYAVPRTVSWTAVTTYTDGSLIEGSNAVMYNVWMQDNVSKTITQLANQTSAVSVGFNDSGLVKGRSYNFWAQAVVGTGQASDNSAIYVWKMPDGKASTPTGLSVN